jgi:hypothetical protein
LRQNHIRYEIQVKRDDLGKVVSAKIEIPDRNTLMFGSRRLMAVSGSARMWTPGL